MAQQRNYNTHIRRSIYVALPLVFLLLSCANQPGAADEFEVSCRETPRLILQAQQPADQCMGSLDGTATRVIINFTYTVSMTGNGDTAPTFETFFDAETSSCEQEYVVERFMEAEVQNGIVFVECRGIFSEGSHTLSVTGVFDNGIPGCTGVMTTADTTAIVIGPPSIRLTKAADAEICFGSKQFTLNFLYEKSASVRRLAMGYTVTVNGWDMSMCIAADTGIGVVVTCDTSDPAGFQSGTYDITLAAYLLEQGATPHRFPICSSGTSPIGSTLLQASEISNVTKRKCI